MNILRTNLMHSTIFERDPKIIQLKKFFERIKTKNNHLNNIVLKVLMSQNSNDVRVQ